MLVEKEIIAPGTYWYKDEATGLPRSLVVTSEMTKYWRDQGSAMLSDGLTVPVPYEHDYQAHPMTPKDKLLNNAGEVKEYRLRDVEGRKDVLFGVVDVQDDDVKKKIGKSIRWTSPWISSFVDGQGKQWNNVISHLALTTRPRVVKQAPFTSIAAALSIATPTSVDVASKGDAKGFCLTRATRLVERKKDKRLCPQFPIAFSLISGAKFAFGEDGDMKEMADDGGDFKKKKKKKKVSADGTTDAADADDADDGTDEPVEDDAGEMDVAGMMDPLQDQVTDVKMEELLCDLLTALGIQMPENVGESEFKRALYEATMAKIKELTGKAQASGDANAQNAADNTTSPAGGGGANPLIEQEQQPMFMSLEDINKITDPTMKNIALSMYNENVKIRAEAETDRKKLASLNDAKLKEENAKRQSRVAWLSKVSPKVKADLDAMLAVPSMALSMGDGGSVVDPMAQTLAVLEKGLGDIPRLLTTPSSEIVALSQPTDGELTAEATDELADGMARMMGCPPEQKKAS